MTDFNDIQLITFKEVYSFDAHLVKHTLRIEQKGVLGVYKQDCHSPVMQLQKGKGGFYYCSTI